MRKYIRLFYAVYAITTALPLVVYTQYETSWFKGEWKGSMFNKLSIDNDFVATMSITAIKGNTFDGILKFQILSDTSSQLVTSISGRIFKSYMKLVQKEVLFIKNPAHGFWETECFLCDSVYLNFKILKENFIIDASTSCSLRPLCSGDVRYSRPLNSLDAPRIASLEKYIKTSEDNTLIADFSIYAKPFGKPDISAHDRQPRMETYKQLSEYNGRGVNVLKYIEVNKDDSINLKLFDNGVIDNDSVTVVYNGAVIFSKMRLTAIACKIRIPVLQGIYNQLIIFADNLGDIPPSTGLAIVSFDDKTEEIFVTSDYSKSSSIIFSASPFKQSGTAAPVKAANENQ